jgi:membrane associated rhomboid family serine protease
LNIAVFLAIWAAFAILWAVTGNRAVALETLHTRVIEYLVMPSDLGKLLVRPWTVITSMFAHYEPGHLFWNMVLLWTIGQLFGDLLGDRRLLGAYLLSGLAGSLLFVVTENIFAKDTLPSSLGASGAVIGIVAMIASYRPEMLVNVILIGPVKLMYFAGVFLLLDFIGLSSPDGVAHAAHIGGMIFGFTAAKLLPRGTDWTLSFTNSLERFWDFVRGRKRARMRVEKRPTRRVAVNVDVDYNAAKKEKQARVDAILDKISRSGYESLSKSEREFLQNASKDT